MVNDKELINNIDSLIGDLKKCINDAGITGDSSEFQIITELFLYKFLNDKFQYIAKKINPSLSDNGKFDENLQKLSNDDYALLLRKVGTDSARIERNQTIAYLFNHRGYNEEGHDFSWFFDKTLVDISDLNADIFSITTYGGDKIRLFEGVCNKITDSSKRNGFAKNVIAKLAESYNFEAVFEEKYDFYSVIFEHLISDYNSNGGGTYAEYYTPRTIANIIGRILVNQDVKNVTVYDPTAGSGTLLMSIAHQIGEDKCTIFSQDLTQKSVKLLRLNLILNGLTHSLNNVHQGNILNEPACKNKNKTNLATFDYIVSNPPFKVDYSDQYSDCLDDKFVRIENNKELKRFFAGVPNIPANPTKAPIYLLVLQHIIYSLGEKSKAGIVVPTKFLDWTYGIAKTIRSYLVDNHYLRAVVSMPSNVFANTGTNVSVLFIDKEAKNDDILLFDASGYGEQVTLKVNGKKMKKTILSEGENGDIETIINVVNKKEVLEGRSVVKDAKSIQKRNYSLVAGQYFDVKLNAENLSPEEYNKKIKDLDLKLTGLFDSSNTIQSNILNSMKKVKYHE